MTPTGRALTLEAVNELTASGLFDNDYYLSQAPDAIAHPLGPVAHYVEHGYQTMVSPQLLFDTGFYLNNNNIELKPGTAPLLHYVRSKGVDAFRPHPLFDAEYYLRVHNDLKAHAANILPLAHYVSHGSREGRSPHPLFDTRYYLSQCGADNLGKTALGHYLTKVGS